MEVLGTIVPEVSHPEAEICHAFVYRWLIERRLMLGNLPVDRDVGPFNGEVMAPVIWPARGRPARQNGNIEVRAGDIVGFWQDRNLIHSMIAITPTCWVGANNCGCFGVEPGRTRIDDISGGFPGALLKNQDLRLGWLNNSDNQWRAVGPAILTVTYRTPGVVAYP